MYKIIDEKTTYIDDLAEIGDGTIIYPNVTIMGRTKIGKDNIIESNTVIKNSVIGKNNKIISSYITSSTVGDNNEIGPYAHLRDRVEIGNNNLIGNFVEIKETVIENNNYIKHLSYLGNTKMGSNNNFSAGAITANYDWKTDRHYRTIIENNSLIGANSVLIAPIKVEDKSVVAAGSVINRRVKERDLAIARPRQQNIKDYVEGE